MLLGGQRLAAFAPQVPAKALGGGEIADRLPRGDVVRGGDGRQDAPSSCPATASIFSISVALPQM